MYICIPVNVTSVLPCKFYTAAQKGLVLLRRKTTLRHQWQSTDDKIITAYIQTASSLMQYDNGIIKVYS